VGPRHGRRYKLRTVRGVSRQFADDFLRNRHICPDDYEPGSAASTVVHCRNPGPFYFDDRVRSKRFLNRWRRAVRRWRVAAVDGTRGAGDRNTCARLLFRIRIHDIDCDHRLIRRSLLDEIHLTSTSGTICVELVRKLELSRCEVAEVGIHHYPRLHGTSQFFRLRSLANTFGQLLGLWVKLVIMR
jgi:hypothetical protein